MSKTKNNGIDLAREIIAMTQEYNRVITARNNEIKALEEEVRYHKRREEAAVKCKEELRHDLEMEIDKLRGTLETVTDIICRHIRHSGNQLYIESLWDWEADYSSIINVLEIDANILDINVSGVESEDNENED